jgi:type IV pilus assembly protein PilE
MQGGPAVKLLKQSSPSTSIPAQSQPTATRDVPADTVRPTLPMGPAARRVKRLTGDSAGFSLPEVLVAILIIGVLAAVAVPSLLSTTAKASDAQAKELAHTAQNAAEVFASDNGGSYQNLSPSGLVAEERTLTTTPSKEHAYLTAATGNSEGYSVTATAANGDQLTITRAANGTISHTCHSPVTKTGCSEGENGSW